MPPRWTVNSGRVRVLFSPSDELWSFRRFRWFQIHYLAVRTRCNRTTEGYFARTIVVLEIWWSSDRSLSYKGLVGRFAASQPLLWGNFPSVSIWSWFHAGLTSVEWNWIDKCSGDRGAVFFQGCSQVQNFVPSLSLKARAELMKLQENSSHWCLVLKLAPRKL
jgi:hypothetical protein